MDQCFDRHRYLDGRCHHVMLLHQRTTIKNDLQQSGHRRLIWSPYLKCVSPTRCSLADNAKVLLNLLRLLAGNGFSAYQVGTWTVSCISTRSSPSDPKEQRFRSIVIVFSYYSKNYCIKYFNITTLPLLSTVRALLVAAGQKQRRETYLRLRCSAGAGASTRN